MDTINDYLTNLLKSQELTDDQEATLEAHTKEVSDFLLAEFKDKKPNIKYAGSWRKGTMIRDNYDLDIVCYFPDTDDRTLKEIRQDVSDHLNTKYMMQDKASAERILNLKGADSPSGYHIDVVPGRFITDSDDVFLHLASGEKERLQTNLKTHINHIANSGCVPVIRLAKIWVHRNNIDIKTFVLELFVVETLSGSRSKDDLKKSFLKVLEEMKDHFSTKQLVDPANSNNIVSRLVPSSAKVIVESAAQSAFDKLDGSDEITDWESVLGEVPEEDITEEDAKSITLADYSHREKPQWPRNITGIVEIKKCIVNGGLPLGSDGWPIPDGCGLNYVAEVSGITGPYEVWWQVVNTGEHAVAEGGLRGKLEKPKNPSTPLQQAESSQYTGKHWIQCYIVQNGRLVAESKPFYLNVVNKKRKKFRFRRR